MPLIIRQMRDGDNLGVFFGVEHDVLHWNPEQVYVAEDAGRLVAMALVFDGGHDVVLVDHVRALPPWEGRGMWVMLLRRIVADMRAKGKKALVGYADHPGVVAMAHRFGAEVTTRQYVGLRKEL